MRNIIFPIALLLITACAYSQEKVAWGDEFKLRKGSTDLAIINADPSGIYLEESHDVKSMGWWTPRIRTSSILVKMNPGLSELYRKDFDKELKGKELETFFFIQGKIYLFASSIEKREKTMNLFAVELDKNSGNLKTDWKQVYTWDISEKGSNVEMRLTPNADSTQIILASTNTAKTQNQYEIQIFDANCRQVGSGFKITNEFDPKTFQVEDFVYTPSGNAILVGRVYEYEEGKKKKDKNLQFQNYNIRIYDNQGKMTKELVTDIDGKFLVNGKLIRLKNQIVLAAFYSNTKKKKEINGLLVQRMDATTGNIISTTNKELNNATITEVEDEDDDKSSRRSKKEEEEAEEGLSANLVFRNFFVAPDNGLVILAEKYKKRLVTSSSTSGGGMSPMSSTTTVTEVYTCEDIYMSKISALGNIDWLNVLPKNQYEANVIASTTSWGGMAWVPGTSYFANRDNRPFLSGFGCLPERNILNIFFNDDEKNADILHPGKKIRKIRNFGKSTCYQIRLDMLTGKYTRNMLFSNKEIPPAMPRLGVVMNNTMYLTGRNDSRWGRNAKLVVGKISYNL